MAFHDFLTMSWNEDIPIKSSTWEPDSGAETIAQVLVTLRDMDQRVVGGISNVLATGFVSPSALAYAWFKTGPSRLGLSNATRTYSLEFKAEDSDGSVFTSILGVKVKKAGT